MLVAAILTLFPAALAAPQDPGPTVRRALAIPSVRTGGRSPIYTDPIELQRVRGTFAAPQVGDEVRRPDGEVRAWREIAVGDDGWFRGEGIGGGLLFAAVTAAERSTWMLRVRGAGRLFVNGEPRVGDGYGLGITRIPVALDAGDNALVFQLGRGGGVQFTFDRPEAPLFFAEDDQTVPDLLLGERRRYVAGVIVVNTTADWRRDLLATVRHADGTTSTSALPTVPPCSMRKVPVHFEVAVGDDAGETMVLPLELTVGADVLHRTELELAVRAPGATHQRTFVSAVDGSVQYYGVTPPAGQPEKPAMFLSLHGAGVEASGQARCYQPKPDGVVIAPTNRRKFGFDWEDWGRLDALEVLGIAEAAWSTDPDRTYVTGHSMGGHGTWRMGALFPDRFAAIGPSAAWRDFWAYGSGARFGDETRPVSTSRWLRRRRLAAGVRGPVVARGLVLLRLGGPERVFPGCRVHAVTRASARGCAPSSRARATARRRHHRS